MAVPESVRIDITSLTYGNCENITIYWEDPVGGLKACDNQDYVTIEVDPDATLACIDLVIVCDDCGPCPPITKTICVCDDRFDCPDCHNCVNGICVSTCDELCVDDVCVECTENSHCQGGKVCVNGNCQCPPGYFDDGTGLCVQCDDTTVLDACFVCVGGFIQPVDCPIGHCNPANDECVECYNSTHCAGRPDGKNCCGDDFECECCPGYVWDQVLGICVEEPDCTFDTDCECGICVNGECVSICEPGQICVDDVCQDPCTGPDDCPDGYGCDGGVCVECATLACTGNGTRCEDVAGCVCNESAECEASDCPPEDQTVVDWDYTPGTSGQVQPGTGAPALEVIATASYVGDVVVDGANGGVFANHSFTVTTGEGVSGTWTVQNNASDPGTTYNGTSVAFDLASASSPVQYNFAMFQVSFVASDGRTATIVFYNQAVLSGGVTEGALLAQNEWTFESRSTGIPDQVIGGTPGVLRLCASHSGVTLSAGSITGAAVSGNIQLTFTDDPSSDNCVLVNVVGCGVWDGTAVVECGNNRYTVDLPEYSREGTCCDDDIIDPLCSGTGSGAPCETITAVNVPLQLTPANGVVAGGRGEFVVTALWNTVLDAFTAFALNIDDSCWSTSAYEQPDPDVDDVELITSGSQTSIFGINPSQWQINATLREGGCIGFGKGCELRISGCQKLEGEICIEDCDVFSVEIFTDDDVNFTAYQSLGSDVAVNFLWYEDGVPTDPQNTTDSYTLSIPNTTITTLRILAILDDCQDDDTITLVYDEVIGCTDVLACDYLATATVSGDCSYINTVGFTCDAGLILDYTGTVNFYDVTGLPAGSTGVAVFDQQAMDPDTYTIRAVCGHNESFYTVIVPQCWNCDVVSKTCNTAVTGANGPNSYADEADCIDDCDNCNTVNFDISSVFSCDGNAVKVTTTIIAGSGDYTYRVKSDGVTIVPDTVTSASPIVVTGIPEGAVEITVIDNTRGCQITNSETKSCVSCLDDDGTVTLVADESDICNGVLTFTVSSTNPSAYPFTVSIDGTSSSTTVAAGSGGSFSGLSLIDGNYTVRALDAYGCVATDIITVSCPSSNCTDKGFNMTLYNMGEDGFGNTTFQVDWSSTLPMTVSDLIYLDYFNHSGSTSCEDPTATWLVVGIGTNPAGLSAATSGTEQFVVPTDYSNYVCYRARAEYTSGGDSCQTISNKVQTIPSTASPACEFCEPYPSGPAIAYNPATEEITVSYCFTESPISMVISDPQSLATWQSTGTTSLSVGSGGPISGSAVIDAVATSTARNVQVTVDDPASTGCSAVLSVNVSECTCSLTITSVTLDETAPEVIVDFDAACTSGDVTVTVSGDIADTEAVGLVDGLSTTSTPSTHTAILNGVGPLPDGGLYDVDIADDVLPCTATQWPDNVIPNTCDNVIAITDATGTCTYDQTFENAGTGTLNEAVVTVTNDEDYASYVFRAKTEQTCGAVVTEVDNTAAYEALRAYVEIGIRAPSSTTFLTSGAGWCEEFRVFDASAIGVAIDIPLGPAAAVATADKATVHVVADADLIYDHTDPGKLETALTEVIENFLVASGFTLTTEFVYSVSVANTASNEGRVSITFRCMEGPTGTWVGVKRADAFFSVDKDGVGAGAIASTTNDNFSVMSYAKQADYNYTNVCTSVDTGTLPPAGLATLGHVIDVSASDINNIALTGATKDFTGYISSTSATGSCDYLNLTADPGTDCTTPAYLWTVGGETTQAITELEPLPGTYYQVRVTCADGCIYFTDYTSS